MRFWGITAPLAIAALDFAITKRYIGAGSNRRTRLTACAAAAQLEFHEHARLFRLFDVNIGPTSARPAGPAPAPLLNYMYLSQMVQFVEV